MLYAGKCLHNNWVSVDESGLDAVFKALADPTRRRLLDRLREQNGQTLGALCERLDMARIYAAANIGPVDLRAFLAALVQIQTPPG